MAIDDVFLQPGQFVKLIEVSVLVLTLTYLVEFKMGESFFLSGGLKFSCLTFLKICAK